MILSVSHIKVTEVAVHSKTFSVSFAVGKEYHTWINIAKCRMQNELGLLHTMNTSCIPDNIIDNTDWCTHAQLSSVLLNLNRGLSL